MEFLKDALGEKYDEFCQLISQYNQNKDNDKQIKLGNLQSGEYLSKAKYESLKIENDNLNRQISNLNTTIKTLENDNQGNGELENTISTLNDEIKKLQDDVVNNEKLHALKEQLSKSGVVDTDYLIYKVGGITKFIFDENNQPVSLDELLKPYKEDKTMTHLFKVDRRFNYDPANGDRGGTVNPFAKETLNLTEQGKLMRENPEEPVGLPVYPHFLLLVMVLHIKERWTAVLLKVMLGLMGLPMQLWRPVCKRY